MVEKKNIKVALVCIAKNEDYYIDEWIEYNKKIGFDDIFIYQNDWRWNGEAKNVHKIELDGVNKQREAYNHFIANNIGIYDWAAFFDVDEFLVLKKHDNIKEFIGEYKDYPAIGINWVYFGDNNHKKLINNHSLIKRFIKRQIGVDRHVKCIVKISEGVVMDIHNPLIRWVSTDKTIHIGPFNYNGNDNVAQINHYYSKTIEEFQMKRNRGRADTADIKALPTLKNYLDCNHNDIDDLLAYDFLYGKSKKNVCFPCLDIYNKLFL